MFPRICIQSSISAGKPRPATWADIEAAMKQPSVQDICDQIKLLDGKEPDELSRLKKHLPAITPHACRFRGDGSRKSSNAISSGLVMLDIDHIDNPRDFFSRWIFPVLSTASTASELPSTGEADLQHSDPKIYFVAITPSGHGIRVIAEREPEESIPAAQKRLAHYFALTEFDAVTKDLARASFLMPWSYVLYCEPSGLDFTDEDHLHKITATCQVPAVPTDADPASTPYTLHPTPAEGAQPAQSAHNIGEADTTLYRGIPYDAIVRELVQL